MKKSKLSLEAFQVQSFVTSIDKSLEETAKGGNYCETEEQCSLLGGHICVNDSSPCVCQTGYACITVPATGC